MSQLSESYYIIVLQTEYEKSYLNEYVSSNLAKYPCNKLPRTTCLFRSAQPFEYVDGVIVVDMLNSKFNVGTDPYDINYNKYMLWTLVKVDITQTNVRGYDA